MNLNFNIWKTNRTHYLEVLQEYSVEQLNKIPEDFNNNLIWNIGHIIAVQQVLIYKRSGLDMNISSELYQLYKSGTKPERWITESEINEIKLLLQSTIDSTEEDFSNGKFESYEGLTTSNRFNIDSLETAVQFNNYHEGLHLGTIHCLKRKF